MQVGRRRVDAAQDILHERADAVLVHRAHVVAPHPGGRNGLLFLLVNRAGTDDGDIRRPDGRRTRARAGVRAKILVPGEEREAHAVHVAGGRGLRGVEVGMGVDP